MNMQIEVQKGPLQGTYRYVVLLLTITESTLGSLSQGQTSLPGYISCHSCRLCYMYARVRGRRGVWVSEQG